MVLGIQWASPKEFEMHSQDPVKTSHQKGPAVIVTLSRAETTGKTELDRPGPGPVL